MKKRFLILAFVAVVSSEVKAQTPKVVTAAQVNGVYRYYRSEFRILAIGHHKSEVQFHGEYMTRARYPNIGEARGEADIEGNVATFIPGETTGCKITVTFLRTQNEGGTGRLGR